METAVSRRRLLACALSLSFAAHAEVPAPRDEPYAPGTILLEVDASDTAQRIFRVRQTIPVVAGPLTLLYPQWLPGNHAPRGPIDKLAGLVITDGNGQKIAWKRDPANVYAFQLDVPQGVTRIVTEYQTLTPADPTMGRVVITPAMLNLQMNTVVLYPAGHYASRIVYDARVKYPAGWQAFTALDVQGRAGDVVDYQDVPLEILVDAPVFAGRHAKSFELTMPGKRPVRLNVVADAEKFLKADDAHLAQHRRLVEQSLKLFGAEHYDHYDFLFALSGQLSGIGLEHQRSSENRLATDYFTGWNKEAGSSSLLSHEYVHSWNGKYRRPADLWTPHYNVPMQDSLLWVYEGQTSYWGDVLNARAGLRPLPAARDALAITAANYAENRPGLQWRSVQDTTNDPIITPRGGKPYRSWQLSEDYYAGAQMMWLEADVLIRSRTRNRRSLDDFARAFFGRDDGQWTTPSLYTYEDVVATLDGVLPYDWSAFLRERLDAKVGLTDALARSGWRLVFKDEPNALAKANAKDSDGAVDAVYSLGLALAKDGKVTDVRWDGPAFDAGVGTGMQVVAVDDVEFSKDALEDAIRSAKGGTAPIRLLVKEFDRYRSIDVKYHGGLRFPHLERIAGTPDYLTPILSARR
jgi:predicted metalloprotease with PDZ domain